MRGLRRSRARRRGVPVVLAVALVAAASPSPGAASAGTNGKAPKAATASDKPAGSWIVVLKDGTDPDSVAKAVGTRPKHRYTSVLSGFAADLTEAQLVKLNGDSRVLSVNENRQFSTDLDEVPPGQPSPQFVPTGVRRVGTLESPTANIDSKPDPMDVDIAVLDTGVDDHIDLNLAGGVDCLGLGGGFGDLEGHGTMVAGMAAAEDNSFGVVGVAPGARVWAVRVLDASGGGTEAQVLCGLDWVRSQGNIEVANMSLGAEGVDTARCGVVRERNTLEVIDPLHFAICEVVDARIVVVAAAGNESMDASVEIPAAYPEVITVSAMADLDGLPGGLSTETCFGDVDDHFAPWSNFGQVVDIAAPGSCIDSTIGTADYAQGDGTSFSTPHVSGAAALLKVRHPNWPPKKIRQHILKTAEPGPIAGDPDPFPEGVLNVRGY